MVISKVIIIGLVVTVVGIIVFKALDSTIQTDSGSSSKISLSDDDDETISVGITGEISKAGDYTLSLGSTMEDLIEKAGGVNSSADERCYFFEAVLEDGESYYIPPKYEVDDVCGNNPIEKVNINDASEDELNSISGVGTTLASNIYEYRMENGKFYALEELKKVSGIGNATFSKMKNEIILKD